MWKCEVTISRVWETCIWASSHDGFEHILRDTPTSSYRGSEHIHSDTPFNKKNIKASALSFSKSNVSIPSCICDWVFGYFKPYNYDN